MRNDLGDRQHLEVAAGVVVVLMRVDDVRNGWSVTDLICARMSAWLRSNMSSTSTTPSEVVYKATLPPSPETM